MSVITFSTCFYILKSKFDANQYCVWAENFIKIANNFNFVIYTDEYSSKFINTLGKPNIKIVLKPVEQFHNYKYKDYWTKNHAKNDLLNKRVEWQVNMLWSEKVWFVNETVRNAYFDTDYYGYCDIGYFRNRPDDLHTNFLSKWPSEDKILQLDKTKIHYGRVNNDNNYMNAMYRMVNNKNERGLPSTRIPAAQVSFAGGFFLLHRDKIDWWAETYDARLKLYFENDYLVKDDQMVIIDCILSDIKNFALHEELGRYDNWFMFQRLLL
jgi:hypothetical protein